MSPTAPATDLPNRRSVIVYTTKEVAAFLGLHPKTISKLAKHKPKRLPPFRKFGGTYVFPRARFHRWLEGEK